MTTLADPDLEGTEEEVSPTITLPALPACVSAVREHVRVALMIWHLEPLTDIAVLLASELATNAVTHAGRGRPFSVVVKRTPSGPKPSGVWIEVYDTDSRPPEVFHAADDDVHGRGLLLVDSLADEWETVPGSGGKCVRFLLTQASFAEADTAAIA